MEKEEECKLDIKLSSHRKVSVFLVSEQSASKSSDAVLPSASSLNAS